LLSGLSLWLNIGPGEGFIVIVAPVIRFVPMQREGGGVWCKGQFSCSGNSAKQHCQKDIPALLVEALTHARQITTQPPLTRFDGGNTLKGV